MSQNQTDEGKFCHAQAGHAGKKEIHQLHNTALWTQEADANSRFGEAFENKCYRKVLGVAINTKQITAYLAVMSTNRRRKLSMSCHVCRRYTLPKIILHGMVEGGRHRKTSEVVHMTGQSMVQITEVDRWLSLQRRLSE